MVHIPKTGGTSIRKAEPFSLTRAHYDSWPEDADENTFSFAFVREPIERFISAYKMFTKGTNTFTPRHSLGSIDKAIGVLATSTNHVPPLSSVSECFMHHALPMTHPFNNLDKAKFIGNFDRLQDDFNYICRQCKFPPFVLDKRHYTDKKPIELTDEQEEFLVEYYKEDYRIWSEINGI